MRLRTFENLINKTMAKFKISGVWKNTNGVITHYAIHTVTVTGITRSTKTTKSDAVKLLSIATNEAVTWLWNYSDAYWRDGEKIEVVDNSYLRSKPDGVVRDNLAHLINYDWL